MPITPISGADLPPAAPSRQSPSTFRVRMDAILSWMVSFFSTRLNTFITEVNALAADLNDQVSAAFTTFSSTSLAVGTGSKSLTVEAGLGYSPGQSVVIARTSAPATRMIGTVTSYNGTSGALVVSVSGAEGSGTHTDWSIGLVPAVGGSVTGVDDVYSKRFRSIVTAIAALNVDCALSDYQTKSISSNSTFTISNVPAGAFGVRIKLVISSAAVPTWWSGVKWLGGANPSSSLGNGTHFIDFFTDDGGTNWFASAARSFA